MFGRFGGGGGGRRQRQASGRGADLRTSVEIGLDEAFAGTKKTITVPSSVSCEACSGTGSEGGSAAAHDLRAPARARARCGRSRASS